MKVRIPCETEKYIVANYGPEWFKPVKDWDWKKNPSNVQIAGLWTKDDVKEVFQVFS